MRAVTLLTASFLAVTAGAAQAQVIVIGDTTAASCYQAAEFGTMGMNEGFNVCTQALATPGLPLRDRAGTYVNRAVIRIRAGDYDGAMNDTDAAIRLIPSMGEAHVNRGAALLNMSRAGDALAAIERGLQLGSGKQHLVYYNRGAAKELVGDVRGAYYDYRHAVELDPSFLLAQEQLGRFQVIRRGETAGNVPMDQDPNVDIVALRTREGQTAR
jgi:tetratricopeptide (TPR) repeat protein